MKMNRAKKGAVVLNKVYGDFYIVDSNSKDENGKIVSAQVLRIKVDDYLESLNIRFTSDNKRELFLREIEKNEVPLYCIDGQSEVNMTEKNAICFRVIKDSYENLAAENWYVSDGVLVKNGHPAAEQGEIEINQILAIFPRKILLGVKAGEDKISLMYFDPNFAGKEFRPVQKGIKIPVPQKVTLLNDNLLLYYSKTHMEEKGEGDEKTTEEVVDASGYLIYDQEGNMLDHEEYDTDPDEDHEIDTPLGKYVLSTDNFIVFQGEFNGKPFTNIYSRKYNELRSIELASKVSSAEENVDGFMLIKTADELAVVSDSGNELVLKPSKQLSKALDQLYGYDFLVDYCNKGRYFILTFASSSYEVKTLKGTFTSDIGLVLTVE
jgi:hypothetical protein